MLVPHEKTTAICAAVISATKGIQKLLLKEEASGLERLGVVVWADDMVLFSARKGNQIWKNRQANDPNRVRIV